MFSKIRPNDHIRIFYTKISFRPNGLFEIRPNDLIGEKSKEEEEEENTKM